MEICFFSLIFSQPSIQWQRCLGGSNRDAAYSIYQTIDGGLIVAGLTYSNDGDVSGWHEGYDEEGDSLSDMWVVRLDFSGEILWQKCLGGTNREEAHSVCSTTGKGVIVVGCTYSNDGDVSGWHGDGDAWVVKLDSLGVIQWQKCLGGDSLDNAASVQQTTDGGFILAGHTYSNDGDVCGNHGGGDFGIVKLDSSGRIQWQKCLGGSEYDVANSIRQTADGGFIAVGWAGSNDGDVSGNHGGADFWVVKLDSSGELLWQKCFGGSSDDEAFFVKQTTDGGFIVAGFTTSNDGDVSGNHGSGDFWVVKLDSSGEFQWQRCLGGSSVEWANSVEQTVDKGFILAGFTLSTDGDVSGNHGGLEFWQEDFWIVKLDSAGELQWQKCLGGEREDEGYSVQQTEDNGFIVVGWTNSNDGDVSGNHGGGDAWVVKLSPPEGITETAAKPETPTIKVSPNPFNSACEISVPAGAEVSIYDLAGNLVHRSTADGGKVVWVPEKTVGSGVYIVRVRLAGGKTASQEVVYLK